MFQSRKVTLPNFMQSMTTMEKFSDKSESSNFLFLISKLSDLLYELIWPTQYHLTIDTFYATIDLSVLFLFVYPRGVIFRQLWYEKLEIENKK